MGGVTVFGAGAGLLYAGVSFVCFRASVLAGSGEGYSRQRRFWASVGGFFLALIALRLSGSEEMLRALLRDGLHEEGAYQARRSIQSVIASIVLSGLGIGTLVFLYRNRPGRNASRRELARLVARLAVVAMCGLLGLRIISLHTIDQLLYHGPHLNWVIDIGSSLIVLASALAHAVNPPVEKMR